MPIISDICHVSEKEEYSSLNEHTVSIREKNSGKVYLFLSFSCHILRCLVWFFGLYLATSESIRIDAKKLKVVLDKDPFGSKVLKRYVESITAERKAEKNSRIMKSNSKLFNLKLPLFNSLNAVSLMNVPRNANICLKPASKQLKWGQNGPTRRLVISRTRKLYFAWKEATTFFLMMMIMTKGLRYKIIWLVKSWAWTIHFNKKKCQGTTYPWQWVV